MSSKYRMEMMVLVIINLFSLSYSFQGCGNSSSVIGCISCTNGSDSLAYNQSQLLYTCTNITNCSVINGNSCTRCISPYFVDNNGACISVSGCATFVNDTCIQCIRNYHLTNGICIADNILYCLEYNGANCIRCEYSFMNSTNNCTIDTNICLQFDYSIRKCIKCNTNQIIKSDGMGCNTIVDNCQVYDNRGLGLCLLCSRNYVFINGSCAVGLRQLIGQQILQYNYTGSTYTYTYLCLNHNMQYNATTQTCISPTNITPTHCKNVNGTVCVQCQDGYYNSTDGCKQCDISLPNCALCSSSTYCLSCLYGYYRLIVSSSSTKCMPCSSYNCLHCSTQFNADNQVQCLSCPINYTLYAGTCFNCLNSSYAYSIIDSKCILCNQTVANCRFCQFTGNSNESVICVQCIQGYYYNKGNKNCSLISSLGNESIVSGVYNSGQILKKLAPGIQRPLYNNRSGLMSICNQTDGYVCICTVQTTNQTSFCSGYAAYLNIDTIINKTVFNTDLVGQYPDQLRMASQFNSFNTGNYNFSASSRYSQYQYWNILSTYTNMQQRNQNINITQLSQHTTAMQSVFSDQKITIMKGNGFYYKFIPKGFVSGGTGDDNYIFTNLDSSQSVTIYVFFNRYNVSGLITGTMYVITNNSSPITVRVRKTRHFDDKLSLNVTVGGTNSTNSVTLSQGVLIITNFPKLSAVAVYSTDSTTTEDVYQFSRIQNIFYSQSWLYILFFIVLYLIFIPLCAIVDCCQSETNSRRKVGQEEPSDKSEDTTIIRINYREFFPLYNVGNTPRPRRLAKVCLFIVNMQHIVTYLTLVYFNLPQNTPIGAIALVVPAYLCTVIMGYICGAIFRKLPGNFKYLINLFSLGYWILWFFLMRIMTQKSSQYRLYILVFSIICFFLDMVIDALQTLLVYFAIKQGESQISLFRCLARWLSYRGYYQFDKLAKQIQGQNQ